MMRAQCCICADLFEKSSEINIAAAPCGHTFHEHCLLQWMSKSSTCPSCRIKIKANTIIKRLYFDIREEDESSTAPAELINRVANLEAQVSELTKSKTHLAEERDVYKVALARCEDEKVALCENAKQAEVRSRLMSREVSTLKTCNDAYLQELKKVVGLQRELDKLQCIKRLLSESVEEIDTMSNDQSGIGESSRQQLLQMMGVIKREYNKAMSDKKTLRKQVQILGLENASYKEKLDKKTLEVIKLRKRVQLSEKEVFQLERKCENNKRRMTDLIASAGCDGTVKASDSFIMAATQESPVVLSTKSPINFRNAEPISPDLFEKSSHENEEEKEDTDHAATFGKRSSVADRLGPSTSLDESNEARGPEYKDLPMNKFSFNKKQSGVSILAKSSKSVKEKRAYDGLGSSLAPISDSSPDSFKFKIAPMKFPRKKAPASKRNPLSIKRETNQPRPVDKFFKTISKESLLSNHILNSSFSKIRPTSSTSVSDAVSSKTTSRTSMVDRFVKSHQPILGRPAPGDTSVSIDLCDDFENDVIVL